MKSIKEFENFKVEGLKYFFGGATTGAGEICDPTFGCMSYTSDTTNSDGKVIKYEGCNSENKPCEQ